MRQEKSDMRWKRDPCLCGTVIEPEISFGVQSGGASHPVPPQVGHRQQPATPKPSQLEHFLPGRPTGTIPAPWQAGQGMQPIIPSPRQYAHEAVPSP